MTVFCKKTYFRVCFRHIAMPIAVVFFLLRAVPCTAQNLSDNELLGNAIEYFQSNKYHEALIIFEKLERSHKLNPRYIAYMGLCYYHEWSFQKACKYFEDALPQLNLFLRTSVPFISSLVQRVISPLKNTRKPFRTMRRH